MGNTLMSLLVKLGLDTKEYDKGLGDTEKKTQTTSQRMVSGLSAVGSATITGGILAAGAAITTVGGMLTVAANEAAGAEAATAELQAVLKSTGGVAGVTFDELNNYAASMQKVTKFSDEQIMSGQSMLLTFTNIGKDVFPSATTATLNLAQKFGSMEQSSTMLGKALNDPLQGVSALRRVGIQLSDEQEAQIKSFMEVSDIASAQKVILGELETQFGGLAEAMGKTTEGQKEILKNKFSDVMENIGTKVLPIANSKMMAFSAILDDPQINNAINSIVDGVTQFAQTVVNNIPQAIETFKGIVAWLTENEGVIVGVLAALGVAVATFIYTTAIPAIIAFLTAAWPVILIMAAIGLAAYLLYEAWTNNWGGIQEKTAVVVDWLTTNIQAFIAGIVAWWAEHGNTIIAKVQALWQGIVDVFNWYKGILTEVFAAFRLAQEGDWYGFGQKLREVWDEVWSKIKEVAGLAWDWLKTNFTTLKDNIIAVFKDTDWKSVGKNIIDGIKGGVQAAAEGLAKAAVAAAKNAIAAVKGFLGIKSPSKVFAEIGKFSMLGFAEGITNFAKVPVNMGIEATNDITSNMEAITPVNPSGSNDQIAALLKQSLDRDPIDYRMLARAMRDEMLKVAV